MNDLLGYKGDLTCSIGVRNLKASQKWFEETLGFSLIYEVEELGWCEMMTPVKDVSLGMGQLEDVPVKGGATLVFGVTDIESARAKLEARKVRFDGPTIVYEGMVKLATFFDPDGNKFMLSQSLASNG